MGNLKKGMDQSPRTKASNISSTPRAQNVPRKEDHTSRGYLAPIKMSKRK